MNNNDFQGMVLLLLWAGLANMLAVRGGYYSFDGHALAKPRVLFRDVFGIFVLFLLVQLVIVPLGALLYEYMQTGAWKVSPALDHGWLNIVAIFLSMATVLAFCLVAEPRTAPLIATGGKSRLCADLALGATSWFICFPIVSLVAQIASLILNYFHPVGEVDQVAVKFLKEIITQPALFWVSFWLIITAVPFVEETLFRGFLQTWLRQRLSRWPAIALTAAIFSVFHFSVSQGWHNIDLIAALFSLSCFLGFLYEKRGSIWASGALHATFNGISEVAILVQEAGGG